MIQVGVNIINVDQVRIFLIQKYRTFVPKIFNLEIMFALIMFENFVVSKVFTFTFYCAIPCQAPVGKIRRPADWVEDVSVFICVRLWDRGHNGYLWVHPSLVINIPLGSGNISTTISTPVLGLVPMTVFRSGWLVEVDDGWLKSGVHKILCVSPEWVRDTHRVFYRPFYFISWQQYMSWLFCTCHPILSDTILNKSGHLFWFV